MNYSIALLSQNNELIEELKNNYTKGSVIIYRNVDAIKSNGFFLILIDADFFDSPDSVQFYLSKIRKKIHDVPVIYIMRVNIIDDLDYDWFFNDVILYPFRKSEVNLRISRLLWNNEDDENVVNIGDYKINLSEYSVYYKSEKIELTYKEFELLRLLAQNRGTVYTRKDLLHKIWGIEYIGGTRTVDVHIRRLRGKLGDEFNSIIETIRNVGYKIKD
jgi:DNA-binding response OmpR family regulator